MGAGLFGIAVKKREEFVAAVGLEEKYDAVRQLIAVGKERGYLLYDEVSDSLPAEVDSSEEIDDSLTTFERNAIEIYEDQASAKAARAVEVSAESGDRDVVVKDDAHSDEGGSDLDLTPGSLEKTNDPVRMYLREMGTVPLLTREGEVTIAKRIERGQLVVMKSITRSPIVIKELIAVGDDLRKGVRSIKEIVQFDDEELTEEKIAEAPLQPERHRGSQRGRDHRTEKHADVHSPRGGGGRASQKRIDRSQPSAGGFERQEISQPRTSVSRPDSGR